MQQNSVGNRPAMHATHAGTGRHHNNDAKHRNMLQIRSLCCPTLPVCPSLNAQLQLGTRSLQATHLSPPLSRNSRAAQTDTENAAKRQQEGKARQGCGEKKNTHRDTYSNRKQARRSSSSRVRRSFNFAAIPAQTRFLCPSLSLSLALTLLLELRHCSSSTFSHTHTHTATQEKREKAEKKGNRKT